MKKRLGDRVLAGEALAEALARRTGPAVEGCRGMRGAVEIGESRLWLPIHAVIGA